MGRYAYQTEVPTDRSRVAIEKLLAQHGATSFAYGWDATHDRIQFLLRGRSIRFILPRVTVDQLAARKRRGRFRNAASAANALDQANRQRWRALYLVIRAKLESVEAGIAVFDQEFLAFIVLPGDDLTVGDMLVPQLNNANLGRLLTAGGRA